MFYIERKDGTQSGFYELKSGQFVHLKPGDKHRFEALEDLTLFEASSPQVHDVVRIEDDFNRKGTSDL